MSPGDADRTALRRTSDGVTVAVRLSPSAAADSVRGLAGDDAGRERLKVAVTAAPEAGKANLALVRLLAKSWSLPKSALTVAAGVKDRRKTIHVKGAPDDLHQRLGAWLGVQKRA